MSVILPKNNCVSTNKPCHSCQIAIVPNISKLQGSPAGNSLFSAGKKVSKKPVRYVVCSHQKADENYRKLFLSVFIRILNGRFMFLFPGRADAPSWLINT